MAADGMTEGEILAAYPDLQREDIVEALRYAAAALDESAGLRAQPGRLRNPGGR